MRLERIVIGVDFSAASEAAASWIAHSFAPESEIVLLHVIELPRYPAFLRGRLLSDEERVRTARERATERLEAFASKLNAKRVQSLVHEGRPDDRIARVATELNADLVVVGEHGQRRVLGAALGSTAERLVCCSPVPVLLARGLPAGPPKRILAPLDESDIAMRAGEWARLLAEAFAADVVALHVLSPALFGPVSAVSSERRAYEFREDYLEQGKEWLRQRLDSMGLSRDRAEAIVVYGEPRHEILAAQQRFDIDLVVMGSRGAGAVSRALLGSVASAVLREASCPVLVITA